MMNGEKMTLRELSKDIAKEVAPARMEGASKEPMMRFFAFKHLPPALQDVSEHFHALARHISDNIARGPERTVALRKLLESKDCAVRAVACPEDVAR